MQALIACELKHPSQKKKKLTKMFHIRADFLLQLKAYWGFLNKLRFSRGHFELQDFKNVFRDHVEKSCRGMHCTNCNGHEKIYLNAKYVLFEKYLKWNFIKDESACRETMPKVGNAG